MRRGTATSNSPARRSQPGAPGFTMIELILVMAILTIAISLTAPALANFFRGRSLDSEARRLLSLTRQGQSRAISEGVPMELWVNVKDGTIGLEAEPTYEAQDGSAVEFKVGADVEIEVVQNRRSREPFRTETAFRESASTTGGKTAGRHADLPRIRFLPDGSIEETSPQALRLSGRDGHSLTVSLSRNRSSYEIAKGDN